MGVKEDLRKRMSYLIEASGLSLNVTALFDDEEYGTLVWHPMLDKVGRHVWSDPHINTSTANMHTVIAKEADGEWTPMRLYEVSQLFKYMSDMAHEGADRFTRELWHKELERRKGIQKTKDAAAWGVEMFVRYFGKKKDS